MKLTITKQFQDFITSLGVSFEDLLKKAGIPNLLWKEELSLSPLEYYRLLQEFDALVTDEQLLAFSDIQNINLFLPPFFAALSSRNGLDALNRFAVYKRLLGPVVIDVKVIDQTVSIRLSFVFPQQQLPRFALLNEQLLLISLLRTGSGKDIRPVSVRGYYDYGKEIANYIDMTPEKATDNELVFRLEDVQLPFLTQNNVMLEFLEPELRKKLMDTAAENSFINVVQSVLFYAIPSGEFTLEVIAHSLGVSPRTLQRNLNAENTTFNEQVQTIQQMLAVNYINDSRLNTADISYLVGYADSSSFSRAFKKWTGHTISQYKSNMKA